MNPEEFNLDKIREVAKSSYPVSAALAAYELGHMTLEQFLIYSVVKLHEHNLELIRLSEDMINARPFNLVIPIEKDKHKD